MTDTRERILDAALAQYEDQGIAGLTQPKVARRAGLRGSHLTYFFPKKADLLAAVLEASHRTGGPDELLTPDRFALLFAVVLEARKSDEATAKVRAHLEGFRTELAQRYGVGPTSEAVGRLVEELRGAGLQALLDDHDGLSLDARAARLGLGLRTGFADADRYEAEIPALVPGHALVHSLALDLLLAGPEQGRMLVSGCGPGREVLALAEGLASGWTLDAVDPSEPMREATRSRCTHLDRVRFFAHAPDGPYDAALSLFVVHLLPADLQRAYWEELASRLRPGGQAVVAWLHAVSPPELDLWCAHASRSLHSDRVTVLRERLQRPGPLHLQAPGAQLEHAASVGLRAELELFHTLGVRAVAFRR